MGWQHGHMCIVRQVPPSIRGGKVHLHCSAGGGKWYCTSPQVWQCCETGNQPCPLPSEAHALIAACALRPSVSAQSLRLCGRRRRPLRNDLVDDAKFRGLLGRLKPVPVQRLRCTGATHRTLLVSHLKWLLLPASWLSNISMVHSEGASSRLGTSCSDILKQARCS